MLILQSQRDPRYSNIILGESSTTIGTHGCTITAIGMLLGLSPDVVNRLFIENKVFAAPKDNPDQKNLVNWTKISQALKGVEFEFRYTYYDNAIVAQNLPCLVEVDGSPIGGYRHWVLYIGGGKLYDPWDGKEKPTSTYKPTGFVVLDGEYLVQQPSPDTVPAADDFYGLDYGNRESMKVAAKTWHEVMIEGKYITIEEHNRILENMKKTGVEVSQEDVEDLKRYRQFKLLGYNTVDDVTKAIKVESDKNVPLQKEIAEVRGRNGELADMVAKLEKEDHVTYDLAQKALDKTKETEGVLLELATITGAKKANPQAVVSAVASIKGLADRLTSALEKKQPQPVTSDNLTPVEKGSGVNFFLQLFQLMPTKRGVK